MIENNKLKSTNRKKKYLSQFLSLKECGQDSLHRKYNKRVEKKREKRVKLK